MPAQYMSPMNPNISYTTSPHTHGSSQWAPPNANLFQQNSTLSPNHMAVPQAPSSSFSLQSPQAFGGGGPQVSGQPRVARSQGSNLTAAAAAAAAVVAAATATAHATATLTLKSGDLYEQPHSYDNNMHPPPPQPPPSHPPTSHPLPPHSLPPSQPVYSGPQQVWGVGGEEEGGRKKRGLGKGVRE